jgi:predicted phosphodiesterase
MKVLLLSDIHGNLPALEEVIRCEQGVDLYISLGDVVNYGPWSNECVDLLSDLKAVTLLGNHEEYFMAGSYPGHSELVRQFLEFCYPRFSRLEVIRTYRLAFDVEDFRCVHTILDKYIFPDTEVEVDRSYFIGHSHAQFIKESAGHRLVNVGSVGQDRRTIHLANYGTFDTESKEIQLRQIPHNIQLSIQKMKELRYPQPCIDYYVKKINAIQS